MTAIAALHRELIARILGENGYATRALRRAAFENNGLDEPIGSLAGNVAYRSYRVTDDDVVSLRAAGLSEDEIFEVAVCAAVGQATRQYDGALAALAEATGAGQ